MIMVKQSKNNYIVLLQKHIWQDSRCLSSLLNLPIKKNCVLFLFVIQVTLRHFGLIIFFHGFFFSNSTVMKEGRSSRAFCA